MTMAEPSEALPAKYDQATEVDIDRTSNWHMAFGLGPHRCLGSRSMPVTFTPGPRSRAS